MESCHRPSSFMKRLEPLLGFPFSGTTDKKSDVPFMFIDIGLKYHYIFRLKSLNDL
jgi:hypothetical protein